MAEEDQEIAIQETLTSRAPATTEDLAAVVAPDAPVTVMAEAADSDRARNHHLAPIHGPSRLRGPIHAQNLRRALSLRSDRPAQNLR